MCRQKSQLQWFSVCIHFSHVFKHIAHKHSHTSKPLYISQCISDVQGVVIRHCLESTAALPKTISPPNLFSLSVTVSNS